MKYYTADESKFCLHSPDGRERVWMDDEMQKKEPENTSQK